MRKKKQFNYLTNLINTTISLEQEDKLMELNGTEASTKADFEFLLDQNTIFFLKWLHLALHYGSCQTVTVLVQWLLRLWQAASVKSISFTELKASWLNTHLLPKSYLRKLGATKHSLVVTFKFKEK